jgi:predicted peroxiredoxin
MSALLRWPAACLLSIVLWSGMPLSGHAAQPSPLFVNMTTGDAPRARMGLIFALHQLERGHPLTVFLNDQGVLLASRQEAGRYGEHQKLLGEMLSKGATLMICTMCIRHYGLAEANLIEGARLSGPDIMEATLFRPDTRTLSW